MTDRPTRRSGYEVVIEPGVRPHARRRRAVTALFVPDWKAAAELLLETLDDDKYRRSI